MPPEIGMPDIDIVSAEQDHGVDWRVIEAVEQVGAHPYDRYMVKYEGVGAPGTRYAGRVVECGYFYYPDFWSCGYN